MRRFASIAIGIAALFHGSGSAQIANEDARLVSPPVSSGYWSYGYGVSISGDRALVGSSAETDFQLSYGGAAYLYERQTDQVWQQVAKLVPSDGAWGEGFGFSVGLWGDRALVGKTTTAVGGGWSGSGAVYVFERQTDGTWIEVDKLTSPSADPNDRFGCSISLQGERAVIGADAHTFNPAPGIGSAYVFERQTDGTWQDVSKLSGRKVGDTFGRGVSLEGDRVVVGAPHVPDFPVDHGTVWIYERQTDGSWPEVAAIEPLDSLWRNWFGYSVSLSGERLLIGKPDPDWLWACVYVFERNGGQWQEMAKLTPSSPVHADDELGYAVSLVGDRAVIDARLKGDTGGSAFVYERSPGGTWLKTMKLQPVDPVLGFGKWISTSGGRALIAGVPNAYVYELGSLYHGPPEIPFHNPGTQELFLRAGPEHAGDVFVLFGSLSGTAPGLFDPLSGLVLPLNPDGYFLFLLNGGGGGLLSPMVGTLDAEGSAEAAFSIPGFTDPSFFGLMVHHAYVALDPASGAATLASNPAPVVLGW